jgi:hypothetical protein
MAQSRLENGVRKVNEHKRRDERMMKIVKKGKLPYIPSVMSWLSAQLDKPSRLITPEDLKKLTENKSTTAHG